MNFYPSRRSTSRILAQFLPAPPNLVTGLTSLLTYVCANTKWEYGEAWIPATTYPVLELSSAWCVDPNLDIERATAWMQFQICCNYFARSSYIYSDMVRFIMKSIAR
jgi:hypothetical protein